MSGFLSSSARLGDSWHNFSSSPSGSFFTPFNLVSLFAWYRGDTVTLAGTKVSSWTDKSTNGYHAIQNTAVSQPVYSTNNGLGYINSTVTTFLAATTAGHTQPYEVFIVANYDGTVSANTRYLIDSGTSNQTVIGLAGSATSTPSSIIYAASSLVSDIAIASNADHIYNAQFNGAASHISIDGDVGVTGNAGAAVLGANVLIGSYAGGGGGSFGWTGRIYEVVIFNSLLSTTDRAKITSYLKTRYSIP